MVTHTAAICDTTYISIKSVLIVNFRCFDSQFYQPISILLNIHDQFIVSVVNFIVSVVNLQISYIIKYHEKNTLEKGFFSAVSVCKYIAGSTESIQLRRYR